MKRYNRNILVFTENNDDQHGFNIYLDFSGKREYLYTHRHNGAMYCMLKDGIRLTDLQRGVRDMSLPTLCGRRADITTTKQLRNSMRYMMLVINEYMESREQCA